MTTYTVNDDGQSIIDRDPNSVLDYSWDWTAWLASAGDDTIESAEVIGFRVSVDSSSVEGAVVTAMISGGTAGTTASATCRITTATGRIEDRTIYFNVVER